MRFLFLNQYFPPDRAPTGILLRELADGLCAAGHAVDFVSSKQDYRAAKKRGGRAVRELSALWSIFQNALKTKPRPDVIVSATSPPLLIVVAALLAKLRGARARARHVHWLFDMYPDLAVALGEIKTKSPLTRFFFAITRWAYRNADLIVALDEDMAAHLAQQHGVEPERVKIIAPWVFSSLLEQAQRANANAHAREKKSERLLLYSGNLGRAHEWETLLEAQSFLEKSGSPWRLIFQGGGPSWQPAQARAKQLGLSRCEWKTYVPESELCASLMRADVLAVTQRPETKGLLWPSKLGLVTALPRRILWIGPTNGAIAQMLKNYPQAGIFSPGQSREIADWLDDDARNFSQNFSPKINDAAAVREAALRRWMELLLKA